MKAGAGKGLTQGHSVSQGWVFASWLEASGILGPTPQAVPTGESHTHPTWISWLSLPAILRSQAKQEGGQVSTLEPPQPCWEEVQGQVGSLWDSGPREPLGSSLAQPA